MFSDCSSKCERCRLFYTTNCYAGHGDDYFVEYRSHQAREDLKNNRVKKGLEESLLKLHPNLKEHKSKPKLFLLLTVMGRFLFFKK